MKICVVSLQLPCYIRQEDTSGYGGAEVQAAVLSRAMADEGHRVTVIVSDLAPDEKMPFDTELAFRSDRGVRGLRFFHPRLPGINRALDRADADVYYQRNAGMITGLTALFCRRKGKVFVYGAGSNTDFSFRTPRLHGLRDRILYYTGLKLADGIVAQNHTQEEMCRRNLRKPVRVIPNAVAVDGAAEIASDGRIVWVGGIRRVKRPELFLELAKRLPDLRFVLIGGAVGTERSFARAIEERAAEIPNVEMTGRLGHAAVQDHLARAALLVNTSAVEGFPNVYLEAWRSGVPVVSFNDVDGLIAEEKLGALCRGIDDMTAQIRALADRAEERDAMGNRAVEVINARFSPAVIVKSYVAYFEQLLEEKRSRRTDRSGKS